MTVPSRIRRILLPRWMWPSVTMQPAMLPTRLTLKTWRISAWPCSFSRIFRREHAREGLLQVVEDLVDHAIES